jgi:hypothetical protein
MKLTAVMKVTTVLMALAVGLSGQIAFGQTDDEESRRGSSGAIFLYTGSDQTFKVPAGVHSSGWRLGVVAAGMREASSPLHHLKR